MIMVENPGHNPDPELTSFSCRLANQFRKLPEGERPNLIELLKEYGELVRLFHIYHQCAAKLLTLPNRQETGSWIE